MSSSDSKDDMTALVVRSAHNLATRSSLVIRGLRDISAGSQEDYPKSAEDRALELFHSIKANSQKSLQSVLPDWMRIRKTSAFG